MEREKPADQRCQHVFENGEQCDRKIDGRGAWQYCRPCREQAAQREAKRERDRKRRAKRRELDREGDNFYHFLYYHKLTEPQLRSLFEHAEKPQEEYSHRDDFFEDVSKKIISITLRISHPLADLPSVAVARVELCELRKSLEEKQRVFGPDSTMSQLKLAILASERDIGGWNSAKALGYLSGMAKKVQKLMHVHHELYGFIHALLVCVEILHIKYFTATHWEFFVEAFTWLNYAEDVCDQVLKRLPAERNQLACFLCCYIELVRVRQAFDAEEPVYIDTHIQAAHDLVAKFVDEHGMVPVVTTDQFISLMNHAERQLRLTKLEHCSIESQHQIAIVKTHLALARIRPDCVKCVHDYRSLLDRNPCLEYRHGLRELKKRYKKKVPNVSLLMRKDNSLYVDTTHLLPFVRSIEGR
jgi:hypothetical protein